MICRVKAGGRFVGVAHSMTGWILGLWWWAVVNKITRDEYATAFDAKEDK